MPDEDQAQHVMEASTDRQSPTISPKCVRYIKLGDGGSWEKECLEKGIIRIGFGTARPDMLRLCQSSNWDKVSRFCGSRVRLV